MNGLFQDVRYALRGFRRSPGFAAVAVGTLAVGIGAATATFSAVDSLLYVPLPFPGAERLVFGVALREGFDPFGTSLLEYDEYRSRGASLESSGVGARRSFHLTDGGEPERLQGAAVMVSYLDTVGVQPLLGRRFAPGEDRPGGPAVALLGHGLWQRRFGADQGVVGKSIQLDGRAFAVVGVLPRGFDMPYGAEVWVPLPLHIAALPLSDRAAHGCDQP